MLPKNRRLRRRDEIIAVMRGRRVGSPRLVVHYTQHPSQAQRSPARLGLAVARKVGNSVTRHRVARRVRHVFAMDTAAWDALDCDIVVRVLPAGAQVTSAQVAADMARARSVMEDRL